MELLFTKKGRALVPISEEGEAWLLKKRQGTSILVTPKEMRNGRFFRKWWALVKFGYDYWAENAEPVTHRGMPIEPDFERFRKDITILAGFHRTVVNIKNEARVEPESLKWGSMTEERFDKLYTATITVLLRRVFNGRCSPKLTEEELRDAINRLEEFAH